MDTKKSNKFKYEKPVVLTLAGIEIGLGANQCGVGSSAVGCNGGGSEAALCSGAGTGQANAGCGRENLPTCSTGGTQGSCDASGTSAFA